jgi:hypothetical protein
MNENACGARKGHAISFWEDNPYQGLESAYPSRSRREHWRHYLIEGPTDDIAESESWRDLLHSLFAAGLGEQFHFILIDLDLAGLLHLIPQVGNE